MAAIGAKKLVTVLGATGAQGGGVINALLEQGGWALRAVTRNPASDAAKKLQAQGVEVVAGDINNKDDLAKAFKGAHGVFAVTTWSTAAVDEFEAGKSYADVAKQQNVQHFVFSSLANAEKISNGTHHVPHFTKKAHVDDYVQQIGLPSTSVQIACYYENFSSMMAPRLNAEGVYEINLPLPTNEKWALGSVAELGLVVAKVFANREQFLGKKIPVAGDNLSSSELADVLSKAWNKPVKANYIPGEIYSTFFPGAPEIVEMFDYFVKFGYFGEKVNGTNIFEGRNLVPTLSTFSQWVSKNFATPPTPQH